MDRKTKSKVERGLLISGIIIAAFGLLSEGLNYPWASLAGREVIAEDPAPVSSNWITESISEEDELVYLTDGNAYGTETTAENAVQVGIIKIPKTGTADNIVEGTDLEDLALGTGHLAGSALPGQPGNCVLTGDCSEKMMRHLNMLGEGDTILISDQENQYTYTVFRTMTVHPTEVWIADPVENRDTVLTVFTATPSGSRKDRFAVQAELTNTAPRS